MLCMGQSSSSLGDTREPIACPPQLQAGEVRNGEARHTVHLQ